LRFPETKDSVPSSPSVLILGLKTAFRATLYLQVEGIIRERIMKGKKEIKGGVLMK
jgi:hypothetical protein